MGVEVRYSESGCDSSTFPEVDSYRASFLCPKHATKRK